MESNSGSYAGRIAPPGMPKTDLGARLLEGGDQRLGSGDLLAHLRFFLGSWVVLLLGRIWLLRHESPSTRNGLGGAARWP